MKKESSRRKHHDSRRKDIKNRKKSDRFIGRQIYLYEVEGSFVSQKDFE